jgi:hypothetical protein
VLTLWDLLDPILPRPRKQPPRLRLAPPRAPRCRPAPAPTTNGTASTARITMQDRYDALTRHMLAAYGIRVRKWRSGMSGIAWCVQYQDGTISRLIEAPRPCGPMSAAVFLHEIGHHAIGFSTYKPRCLEEYHAWAWAIARMEEHRLNITDDVRRRMHLSLWYAVDKARRRGLRELPPELHPYQQRPPSRRRQRA